MAGLPEPKVVSTLANRGKQIDDLVDAANPKPAAKPATPETPTAKPITADEATKNAAKWKADQEAFDAAAKGMPKPSLLDRAKKAVGL